MSTNCHSILDIVGEEAELLKILEVERAWRPAMTVLDIGKLLCQAVFGGDHWLRDAPSFRRALAKEWWELPDRDEIGPLAPQRIDPLGRTVRLHLLPLRAAWVGLDEVAEFLLARSPNGGQPARWREHVRQVEKLSREGKLPLSPVSIRSLLASPQPGHHSPRYGFAAYRVIHDVTVSRTTERLRQWGIGP